MMGHGDIAETGGGWGEGKIQPLAHLERVRLSDVLPLQTPFSVYIFPTNFCNFKCSYCAHSLSPEEMEAEYGLVAETMPIEIYRRAIDQLAAFPEPVKLISLTGQGEPLLNRRLPEMIAYAKEKGVCHSIEFMTNGALLTHAYSAQLVEAGLDCIRISLQGLSSQAYRSVCGTNVEFEALREQIAWLYAHRGNCRVYVKVIDTALAQGEEEAFYRLFSPISDRVFIERCKPVYSGVAVTQGLSVEQDRYGRRHEHRRVCPLSFYMLGIFPNGDVSPCETIYLPEVLGNVQQDTLLDIWQGEKLRGFQRMQLEGRRMEHSKCAKCCAPDDVSHPEDCLDTEAARLLEVWS